MNVTQSIIRKATPEDASQIFELYKTVSKNIGGLARTENEITRAYVENFSNKSFENGLQFVVIDPLNEQEIIAEIHCYQLEPGVFKHILSELTVAVHPEYQGKGLGKQLFQALLGDVQLNRPDILRVELIARESNIKAIQLYENLGFKIEGRFENRINNGNNSFEADIPMAWFPSKIR
ncbi:GNAT family N-acetyltransferase [Pedobacter caeni]|uniref:Ribosomal protein S18 acetylase RimI n=1 Tax=Pedobacter caeni TaxID=288992 RepID=A0A1M5G3L9_9SPHI|nr:N-acetyltransferase [Pedobacter caeni]SHF98397.1 Ribosomal protein S18 acetylase RimI [Pedobacter caeni]